MAPWHKKTHPGPQERMWSSKGQREAAPAFAYRHQQGWLTVVPQWVSWTHTRRFLPDAQVTRPMGASDRKSPRSPRGTVTPILFLPYLVTVLTVWTVQIQAQELSPFLSESHLPFYSPHQVCLLPSPAPPLLSKTILAQTGFPSS